MSWDETLFVLPNWKWVAIVVALAVGFLLRLLLSRAFLAFKSSERLTARAHPFLRYLLEAKSASPDAWILVSLFWISAIHSLKLPENLQSGLLILAKVWLAINVIRWLYMACDALGKWLADLAAATESTADDQLVPFAVKTLKMLVIVIGVLVSIQNFGINVVSILAGLGLGGLALALAAQDTAANLFGSVTILMDRPFQVGDTIKVTDTQGVVLDVGFRSTRLRTPTNTVVTIPNSIMAKEKIENITSRTAIRIQHVIGVTYNTSEMEMKTIIDQLKYYLHQHPKIRKEDAIVAFASLGDFSLGIRLSAHALVSELKEEAEIQQEILFKIMQVAQEHKVEFAFPTQTLHVEKFNQGPQA